MADSSIIHRYAKPRAPSRVDHAVVYRREDEFCSWPYTSGFWRNGEGTLIANFASRTVKYSSGSEINHDALEAGSGSNPKTVTVRSRDNGLTWDGANPQIDMLSGPVERGTAPAAALPGPVNYLDPNVLVANASLGGFAVKESRGTVRLSKDGGNSWTPPVVLPLDGLVSTTGIHSTLVRPDGRCLLFMFEVDQNNANRRPLVYCSTPDGTQFHFLSYITPKVDVFGQVDGDYSGSIRFIGHRWFYPRGAMLPNGRILCTLRCQRDPTGVMWTEVYASDDGGETWAFLSRVNDWGSPGSLVVMPDGRVVVTYGYRLMPSGIRAVVSEDGGRTWSPELVIRQDGGSWDLGYPNAWVAGNGEVGVLYYFNSKDDRVKANGGVRHIARSIFSID
ncbi:MAG: sialidase family protein [Croceibacterium sp.]